MKKFITITLCSALLLSITACTSSPKNQNNEQIPNPLIQCNTIKDAESKSGFKINLPNEILEDYIMDSIYVIKDNTVEINYSNGKNKICLRQSKADGDISGVYTEYSNVKTIIIDGLDVLIKGNNDKVNVAIFRKENYTFAITIDYLEDGIESSDIIKIIESIQ